MKGFISYSSLTSLVRLFALQHEYFFTKGASGCAACGGASLPTLSHALCECPTLAVVRRRWDVPTDPRFLRVFLLGLSSWPAMSLVGDVTSCLDAVAGSRRARSTPPPPPQPTDQPPDPGVWEIWWDGSYHPDGSAGLGITLGRAGAPPMLKAAVPVRGSDATWVKALGPPLAALLLTGLLDLGPVAFHGDSAHVVCLLAGEHDLRDLHLFNCVSLTRDLLTGWPQTSPRGTPVLKTLRVMLWLGRQLSRGQCAWRLRNFASAGRTGTIAFECVTNL